MIDIQPMQLKFLPKDFVFKNWEDIEPYTQELLNRPINSLADYQRFLEDENEIDSVASEEYTRRYIRVTCHSNNQEYEEALNYYLQNISPKIAEYADQINRKTAESPFAGQVAENGFALALKGLRTQMELFRPENIALEIADEELANKSGKIRGAMTVTLDGEEMPLPKAGDRLFWTDRAKREEAWLAMNEKRYASHKELDDIYVELVKTRTHVAKNAGFENYRDYKFKSLKRYDYTPEDCFVFHKAIEESVVPFNQKIMERQKKELGLDVLRPWDGSVDPKNRPPLKAFESADDLTEKSLKAFANIDSVFYDTVALMKSKHQLDLASRPNKRPGAYMTSLPVTGIPFIFANATEKVDDLTTMVHEVGHAVHDIQMRDLRLNMYKNYPMEVAELASMSMELISHDQWHLFFPKEEDLRRARLEHLEGTISFFPWMAQIDLFQHEIYTQPNLTTEERHDVWDKIHGRFSTKTVDWSGFEHWRRTGWQKQGHLFENPFYYIEYGIAQLGALQVWRNYTQDKKQAIKQYKNALALGYTKSIPEIYETAGIKFDFSASMLKELMAFVQAEMEKLQ